MHYPNFCSKFSSKFYLEDSKKKVETENYEKQEGATALGVSVGNLLMLFGRILVQGYI